MNLQTLQALTLKATNFSDEPPGQVSDLNLAGRTKPGSPFIFWGAVALWSPLPGRRGSSSSAPIKRGNAERAFCLPRSHSAACLVYRRQMGKSPCVHPTGPVLHPAEIELCQSPMRDLMSCDLLLLEEILLPGSLRFWLSLQVDSAPLTWSWYCFHLSASLGFKFMIRHGPQYWLLLYTTPPVFCASVLGLLQKPSDWLLLKK